MEDEAKTITIEDLEDNGEELATPREIAVEILKNRRATFLSSHGEEDRSSFAGTYEYASHGSSYLDALIRTFSPGADPISECLQPFGDGFYTSGRGYVSLLKRKIGHQRAEVRAARLAASRAARKERMAAVRGGV